MSLNARVALAAAIALLLAPVWLPALPWLLAWRRRQVQRGRELGYAWLDARQAESIAAYAEATLPPLPSGEWAKVAHNVDRYLAGVHSPRRWRIGALLTLLEFAPLLRRGRPLSRMPVDVRREFLERHMATTRGILAIPALARQLVRMGYYTDPEVAARLGFRTMAQRLRRAPEVAAEGRMVG